MGRPTIVALGDSLTQGFAHGALHRPQWSYPAMVARSCGLEIGTEHRVPQVVGPGYPLNLDDLTRHLADELGDSLELREWLVKLPRLGAAYLARIEELYERGEGAWPKPDVIYHNLAAWGFTVNDALTLTPREAAAYVAREEGLIADDLLSLPAAGKFRAAQEILNPAGTPARAGATMLDNLRELAAREPIDIVMIWLGANDCLPAMLELRVEDMPANYVGRDPLARRAFNLTSEAQFEGDFAELVAAVSGILAGAKGRRQVYVGTVPHMTILPTIRGVGALRGHYFERYVRFFRTAKTAYQLGASHLDGAEVAAIDRRIDGFNRAITAHAGAAGWTLVDTASLLDRLSIVRHDCIDDPGKPLRDYLAALGYAHHPLLELDPLPSLAAYAVEAGADGGAHRRVAGGLVGLDHVHPSTIGYGLAAERFLAAIRARNPDDPELGRAELDWGAVMAADSLLQAPPRLWDDLMNHAETFAWLWELPTAALARQAH